MTLPGHCATDANAGWPACRRKLARPCLCTTAYPTPPVPCQDRAWHTTAAPDHPRTTPSGAPAAPPTRSTPADRAAQAVPWIPNNILPPTSGAYIPGSLHLPTDTDRCSAAVHPAISWPGLAPAPVASSVFPPL